MGVAHHGMCVEGGQRRRTETRCGIRLGMTERDKCSVRPCFKPLVSKAGAASVATVFLTVQHDAGGLSRVTTSFKLGSRSSSALPQCGVPRLYTELPARHTPLLQMVQTATVAHAADRVDTWYRANTDLSSSSPSNDAAPGGGGSSTNITPSTSTWTPAAAACRWAASIDRSVKLKCGSSVGNGLNRWVNRGGAPPGGGGGGGGCAVRHAAVRTSARCGAARKVVAAAAADGDGGSLSPAGSRSAVLAAAVTAEAAAAAAAPLPSLPLAAVLPPPPRAPPRHPANTLGSSWPRELPPSARPPATSHTVGRAWRPQTTSPAHNE